MDRNLRVTFVVKGRNPRSSPFRSRPSRGVRRVRRAAERIDPSHQPAGGRVSPPPSAFISKLSSEDVKFGDTGSDAGNPPISPPALARSKPTGVWLAPCVSFLSPPPSPPKPIYTPSLLVIQRKNMNTRTQQAKDMLSLLKAMQKANLKRMRA